eukprot:UN06917
MSSLPPSISQRILTKTNGVGITHPHNTSKSKKMCIFPEISNFMGLYVIDYYMRGSNGSSKPN